SHLFPGVVGLHPSSFHRRMRKLRRFLEPLRREILSEMIGDPETLLVDSTLLEVLHPRQVPQSSGFPGGAWVRWGSFSVYGVKLHMLCATNGVPISYELTPANVADVSLTEELIAGAKLGYGMARRLLGDLAYRSGKLREVLAEMGILLSTERAVASTRGQAASRDRHLELEEGVRCGRNVGDNFGGAGHQDRGEDLRLHLRLPGQQDVGSSSRSHQGAMGMNLTTHI
ncbi:MAG TPA: transposase, partial [Rubrobacter sp.]|nr:transposase [Rubrobacter sp.]